ncbi:mitochondrial coenzyme A diphosphatase NUDT8 [Culicoides brevitarsis]|uniref:mitochondrial coenzyme A diphosphatase NUDT8 n=1 Tax=Culicoides brevitarsis TaxID=469753 RepID=UPI00307C2EE0
MKMYTTKYLHVSRDQIIRVFARNIMTLKEISTTSLVSNFKKSPEIRLNDKPVVKSAGVLIGLCENNGNLGLLYTLRSCLMKNHTRQVSFPGGIFEPGTDKSYEECALRETEEETGIPKSTVEILGTGNLLIPYRGKGADQIQIMPVVGIIHNFDNIQLKPNTNEVEKVFTVSIERLIDERYRRYTQYRSGRGYSTPVYTAGEERIWGLSAILTHLFLTALLPKEKYSRKIPYVQPYQMQS